MSYSAFIFILSGICFSTTDALIKILVKDTNFIVVAWARFAGQLLFSIPLVWYFLGKNFWRTKNIPLQLLRSIFLAITSSLFIIGLYWLPLAEASSIAFTAPIWVAILSGPFLGEKVEKKEWLIAGVGFLGILFIARPGSVIFHITALLLVLMAIFNALFQLSTRKLVQDSAYTTFFYSGVTGAILFTFALPFSAEFPPLPLYEYGMFIAVGVLAGFGQLLVVLAFYKMRPHKLTPLVYLQMIWATALGYLIFDQFPDNLSIFGMLLIASSGLWLILHHHSSNTHS